jgi:hypothetical protein
MRRAITILALAALVAAHGDHTFDLEDANDEGMSYAERHVSGAVWCGVMSERQGGIVMEKFETY